MRMGQGTFTACLVLDAVVRLYGHDGLCACEGGAEITATAHL